MRTGFQFQQGESVRYSQAACDRFNERGMQSKRVGQVAVVAGVTRIQGMTRVRWPGNKTTECVITDWLVKAQPAPAWTKEPPDRQDTYWHWDGDQDSAPLPYHVAYMGHSREFAVTAGQYGLTSARNVKEMGGWWMPLCAPSTKDVSDRASKGAPK